MVVRELLPEINRMVLGGSKLEEVLRSVSKEKGVSVSALRAAYYRQPIKPESYHGNKKLNPDQERALLYIAQTFSINNRSLCISEMCELVKKAWKIDVSAMTIRRWIREQEEPVVSHL